jgi:hypothetical protein
MEFALSYQEKCLNQPACKHACFSLPLMQPNTSDSTSTTSLQDLPPHLQHLIFASAAAPLTTCKASAAIAQDASLTAMWLVLEKQHPLHTAAQHQLWDVCLYLLYSNPWRQYRAGTRELQLTLYLSAEAGATAVVAALLGSCALQSALRDYQTDAACLLVGEGPPDYFMSDAPPRPGIRMDDMKFCVSVFLAYANDDRRHQHFCKQQCSTATQRLPSF